MSVNSEATHLPDRNLQLHTLTKLPVMWRREHHFELMYTKCHGLLNILKRHLKVEKKLLSEQWEKGHYTLLDTCRTFSTSAPTVTYRGADKSLARPGRKQTTATEDFEFHISYL
jgi:hypothetical protein